MREEGREGSGGRGGGGELGEGRKQRERAATGGRELGKAGRGGGGRGAKLEDSREWGVTAVRALDYSLGETELGMGWVAGHTEDFNCFLNTSKKHSYQPYRDHWRRPPRGSADIYRDTGEHMNLYPSLSFSAFFYVEDESPEGASRTQSPGLGKSGCQPREMQKKGAKKGG